MAWRSIGTAAALLLLAASSAHPADSDDPLQRTRAAYAALQTYADTGSVDLEFGPATGPLHEHHTFTTYYRAPRTFFFDFVKHGHIDRFVVWSDSDAFHSWWQQPGLTQTYPKGQGAGVFAIGSVPTSHALTVIAPLLFAQARLTGTLTEIGDASAAGSEAINGHPCLKIVGTAKSVYQATGHETNIRKTTVWIDAQSMLVRRVFEDTPEGGAATNVGRTTTTIDPHANPVIDDSRFKFTPPSGGK
jgi:outer membrane lipoprotein-sorting protein